MKRNKKISLVSVCLFTFVMMSAASLAMASEPGSFTGLVTLDDYGDAVINVGGKTYILDGAVHSFEGKKVVVTGVVELGEDGLKYIVVDSIDEVS